MKAKERILALEHEKALLQDENKGLQEELQRKLERIAWLEKQLFGPKRDKCKSQDGPTLFDEEFNAAYDARQAALRQAADDVSATAAKRRSSARKRSSASRPEKYLYCGRRTLPDRQQRRRARTEVLGDGAQELPLQQERPGSRGQRRLLHPA